MDKKEVGKIGEYYAENYLTSQNFCVIKKNYQIKEGEIDLIAYDFDNDDIVFIEVKTRTTNFFGEPQDSVTRQKKNKIIKTALHFLNSSTEKKSRHWRVDVIAVKLDKKGKFNSLIHFKNAAG